IGPVMVDSSSSQAAQAFMAGKLGMDATSSAYNGQFERAAAGKFTLKEVPFPLSTPTARLPAGGAVAMMFARDAKRQRAAWEFIKFATGPIGQTIMVKENGYAPGNTLPVNDPKLLEPFYREHPIFLVGVNALPHLSPWFSFPGGELAQDHQRHP